MPRHNKLLVLVTGEPVERVRERHGDFVAIVHRAIAAAWPYRIDAVDARQDDSLEAASADADAIVITGSAANVHHGEPWMLRAQEFLRAEHARGTPILGLCFGHQLLAQALGGEVTPNPRGRELSTVTIERLEADPLFDGIEPRFSANACHLDTVARLPDAARVLARSPLDDHQVLRFSERCYGVQFHPEFDGAVMRGYVEARSEQARAEGLDPDHLARVASDTPAGPRILANFIRTCVG